MLDAQANHDPDPDEANMRDRGAVVVTTGPDEPATAAGEAVPEAQTLWELRTEIAAARNRPRPRGTYCGSLLVRAMRAVAVPERAIAMITPSLRRLLFLPVLLLLAVAVAAPARAAAPTSTGVERSAALVEPSIAYLDVRWEAKVFDTYRNQWLNDGEPLSADVGSCTGFFVNPDGYIATAGHCVSSNDDVKKALLAEASKWAFENNYFSDNPSLGDVLQYAPMIFSLEDEKPTPAAKFPVSESGLPSGRTVRATVVGERAPDDGDVALLKIVGQDLPGLKLAPAQGIEVGTRIISVGYPGSVDQVTDSQAFNPSFKDGTVSSKKTSEGIETYEVSAAVSQGMSGGPTVDARGRVIGINSFNIKGETQPFNFVSPVSVLLELMRDKGVTNKVGGTNALYQAGIEAYFAGDRDEALENLDAVLAEQSSHPTAQKFRNRARKLPVAGGGVSGGLVGAIGAAALLLVGLATFALLRRRRRVVRPAASAS